ncbi:hypothetical protein [Qiania dongpingensis]|uniref:Uncharacterized protein n=1 Tax=Qiania dongpingensis TaxID=2763669 RepID=A0A7G9G0Y9_9FIRM|nr:hypothetical protein [Qiania dongpingensis]QNM04471.1 hypothetical protein H9Q78_08205 [Qiania dongpingensis]
MYKMKTARREEFRIREKISGNCGEAGLISLVYGISNELSLNPDIFEREDGSIWIYYEHSEFPCSLLLDEYGALMAALHEEYPIVICGNADGKEAAQLQVVKEESEGIWYFEKSNLSGEDFDELESICIVVSTERGGIRKELAELLRGVRWEYEALAVRRSWYMEKALSGLEEMCPGAYFRYLPLTEDAEETVWMESLTVTQMAELWSLLLENGVGAAEFEYALEALEHKNLNSVYSWELSLRMALNDCGVTVQYEDHGFRMERADGRRMVYDYGTGTAAEKMLLKILFPVSLT